MQFPNYSKKDLEDPGLIDAIMQLMSPQLKSETSSKKLFICCPIAHLEPIIMRYFNGEHYFLTTLGCRFNWNEQDYLQLVDNLIKEKEIYEINFIQDLSCPFLKSVVQEKCHSNAEAEEELRDLYYEYQDLFSEESSLRQKINLLAQLNLYHQIQKLTTFLIDHRPMDFHKFQLSSYTYTPEERCFEEVELQDFDLYLK
jgi:hypothetical protein